MLNRLYKNPNDYAQDVLQDRHERVKRNRKFYFSLNIISAVFTFATGVLFALIFSKELFPVKPEWFFYSSAGFTAGTTLVASTVNYFMIRDNMHKYSREIKLIEREIYLHENKIGNLYKGKDRDFYLYASIASIVGSKEAKKEVTADE